MEILPASYDLPLVVLSVLVALFSSYAALHISSQLPLRFDSARRQWVLTGASILALGFWAMHFIGMLAFRLPIEVSYQIRFVLLSIVPAFLSCCVLFRLINRPDLTKIRIVLGALLLGSGIIVIHYIGMAAMQVQADIRYHLLPLLIAAAVAFALSLVSVLLLVFVREFPGFHWKKALSAVVMAMAVTATHYIGMGATVFEYAAVPEGAAPASFDMPLAHSIAIGILLIFLIIIGSIRVDTLLKSFASASSKKFESVVESAQDAIIVSNQEGTVLHWNDGAARLFGYEKEEVIGENICIVVPERLREQHVQGIRRYLSTGVPHAIGQTVELEGLKKDGTEFPLEMSLGSWSTKEGTFFSGILRDITERKKTQERIDDLVYRDPLTGLANRRLFYEQLGSALDEARTNEQSLALLYLDLDRFKLINDTFGHQAGDRLLKGVAERLQDSVRQTDLVARLGGDEFILLLQDTDCNGASHTAKRVLEILNVPLMLSGEQLVITPSIGISLFPSDGNDAEALIRHADIAMYRAKEEGKNDYRFFKEEMNETISKKTRLSIAIRKGLERQEFSVHYQPKVDLETERIAGVEALLRWNHPEWGAISPTEFIPVAEETGSILQLGEFVLREACRQSKTWQDAGLPCFDIAVNISASQFSRGDLSHEIRLALDASGLAAKHLELEVTESVLQETASAASVMDELKELGVRLSLDDFGTGYSSLSYLKAFPFDTLKIDQHFIRNIGSDATDTALVETMLKMAHTLELNVIAEGVETVDQLDFLKQKGCNRAQGYYFHRPMPAEEIEKLFAFVY